MADLLKNADLMEGAVMFTAVLLVMVALRIVPFLFTAVLFVAAILTAAMLGFYEVEGVVSAALWLWKSIGGRSGAGLLGGLAAASLVLLVSQLQRKRS